MSGCVVCVWRAASEGPAPPAGIDLVPRSPRRVSAAAKRLTSPLRPLVQDRRIAKSKERYERENDAPPVIPFEAQQQVTSEGLDGVWRSNL